MPNRTKLAVASQPSLGRKDINLRDFYRGYGDEVLQARLDGWSVLRLNSMLAPTASYRHYVHTENGQHVTCNSCSKRLIDVCGITEQQLAVDPQRRDLNWNMVCLENKGERVFFCHECAQSRDAMVENLPKAFDNVVCADGQDVFGFIAATVSESFKDEPLYRAHNVTMKPTTSSGLMKMAGGKLYGPTKLDWPRVETEYRMGKEKAAAEKRMAAIAKKAEEAKDAPKQKAKGGKAAK